MQTLEQMWMSSVINPLIKQRLHKDLVSNMADIFFWVHVIPTEYFVPLFQASRNNDNEYDIIWQYDIIILSCACYVQYCIIFDCEFTVLVNQ